MNKLKIKTAYDKDLARKVDSLCVFVCVLYWYSTFYFYFSLNFMHIFAFLCISETHVKLRQCVDQGPVSYCLTY